MLKEAHKTASLTDASVSLLKELLYAAQTSDILDAAELLKRMLLPWGIRSASHADRFTPEDIRVLTAFWRICLNLPPGTQDIKLRGLNFYGHFCAALYDPSCAELYEVVREDFKTVASVCSAVLQDVRNLSFERSAPKQNRESLKVYTGGRS